MHIAHSVDDTLDILYQTADPVVAVLAAVAVAANTRLG